MLERLVGWQRSFEAGAVRFTPPGAPEAGFIQVRSELAPLRSLRALAAARVAAATDFAGARLGPLERLVTAEGESAGFVRVRGAIDGVPAERIVGLVIADDRCLEVESLARDPERADEVRDLVRALLAGARLGLGSDRWRRFEYAPPLGWRGQQRGLTAIWVPPGLTAEETALTVPAARPLAHVDDAEALFADRLLGERCAGAGGEPQATTWGIDNGRGLSGSFTQLTVGAAGLPARACDTAVLGDGRYTYVFRLECAAAERGRHDELLAAVIRSARPVPEAPRRTSQAASLAMWVD